MTEIEITADRAIERLEFIRDHELWACDKLSKAAIKMSISALRAQQERENPKPLTLDELRERDGKPVWIEYKHGAFVDWYKSWAILARVARNELGVEKFIFKGEGHLGERQLSAYGKTWLAYDYPPKEDDHS